MGIRFWSMFKFPFDTQDIGGQLRPRTEAKGQRSIRTDLNMQDPYQALYRESSRFERSIRKWVEVRPTSTKPFRR